ncbi:MAG TPA: response regulator [Adhaeribacter sp.]|nr:response regulator [Adhaeribacter sp.]
MTPLQILLLEDDNIFRNYIAQIAENNGFTLQSVSSAKAGLELLKQKTYDLILIAEHLPDMHGFSVTEIIRKQMELAATTPIILYTDKNGPKKQAEGLLLGANSFLQKPFTEKQLLNEIETLML